MGQGFPLHPSVRHSQTLVHQRARGRVLQELLLLRIQMMLDRERGQRRLVESGQDQLLLARIGVDVADRKDPGEAGLELLGVDLERLLLERQSPLGDRSELRVQPKNTSSCSASSGSTVPSGARMLTPRSAPSS